MFLKLFTFNLVASFLNEFRDMMKSIEIIMLVNRGFRNRVSGLMVVCMNSLILRFEADRKLM